MYAIELSCPYSETMIIVYDPGRFRDCPTKAKYNDPEIIFKNSCKELPALGALKPQAPVQLLTESGFTQC
jgi:hypothetical protein